MSESIEELKKRLEARERELDEIRSTFEEIKNAYETLNLQFQKKDIEIQSLKSNLEMKETQIQTISGIIKSKDELIASLQETLKMKDDQIDSLNEVKKSLENELKSLKETLKNSQSSSVSEDLIKEKDKKIEELQKEIKLLNLDLKAADDEVLELSKKLKELENAQKSQASKGRESLNTTLTKDQIIEIIIDMLNRALHNINLTTPDINDLAELQLYDVRASVNIKASCFIDPSSPDHQELLEEFNALDNITLRNFPDQDRWVCLKDNEEMLIAAVGENNNYAAVISTDSKHIKLFNSLITESWLRARKI